MATKELMVRVGADVSGFEKAMTGVQKKMKTVGSRMKSTGKSMTKWVTGPMAAATTGLSGLVMQTAKHGDEMAKNSQKVGMNVEAYQEYQYALGQAGLSSEQTDKALGRLNQRMGQAVNGNDKYANALEQLGISLEEVEKGNISTDEAMMKSIETLSQMDNEQEKAALATELFGTKMARDLMPAINAGADSLQEARDKAQDLGIVMSEETAQKSEEFNDKMEDLKSRLQAVGLELGTKLLPVITDQLLPAIEQHVIPLFTSFGEKINELIQWFMNLNPKVQKTIGIVAGLVAGIGPLLVILGSLVGAVAKLAPLFTSLIKVVKGVTLAVKGLGIAMKFLATNPIGLAITAVAGLIAIGIALYKNWDDVKEWISDIWGKIKSVASSVFGWIGDFINSVWSSIKSVSTSIWSGITGFLTGLWDGLKSSVSSAFGWIKEKITSIWNSIKRTTSSAWEAVGDTIKGVVNGVIGAINALIDGWNGLEFGIPSVTIPNPLGSDWEVGGFSIGTPDLPRIPTLAVGTNYVAKDGLAMLHKGEAVVPKRYNPAVNNSSGQDSDDKKEVKIEIPVNLDGREVARVTAPYVDRELGKKRNEKRRARGGR